MFDDGDDIEVEHTMELEGDSDSEDHIPLSTVQATMALRDGTVEGSTESGEQSYGHDEGDDEGSDSESERMESNVRESSEHIYNASWDIKAKPVMDALHVPGRDKGSIRIRKIRNKLLWDQCCALVE